MKKLLALLLILALCLPALGCHSATTLETFQAPDAFDTTRQFEITFWAKHESNIVQKGIYEQTIRDFEALYPNIKVQFKAYTNYQTIYNDVLTNIQTSTTPNVCITYPDHIATYLTGSNTVVPLDNLFTHEKYGLGGSELLYDGPTQEEIIPQFLEECVVNDGHYAVPYMRSTEACYINKDLVEKLGFTLPETLTWEFIWKVCDRAMAIGADPNGNYINGQKKFIPFIYKSTDNMMIQYLRQADAGYSDADGNISIFNDTTGQFLTDISQRAQTRAFSTFSISSYPANWLNKGQCIFAIDSTAGATWMGCNAPLCDVQESEKVRFETAVMTIPQLDPENPKMISQGPSVCIFNKEDPQEVLASWLFTQYLLTNEVQIAYAQTEGYIPVTAKAHNDPAYQDYLSRSGEDNNLYYSVKIDTAKLLLANTGNTFVTPVFNGSTDLRQCAGEMIEEVTKASRRGTTVDDAYLAELYEKMVSLFHLNELDPAKGGGVKKVLGPLPGDSVALLCCLGAAWVGMGIYIVASRRKKRP